jgi:hypothetical protein
MALALVKKMNRGGRFLYGSGPVHILRAKLTDEHQNKMRATSPQPQRFFFIFSPNLKHILDLTRI